MSWSALEVFVSSLFKTKIETWEHYFQAQVISSDCFNRWYVKNTKKPGGGRLTNKLAPNIARHNFWDYQVVVDISNVERPPELPLNKEIIQCEVVKPFNLAHHHAGIFTKRSCSEGSMDMRILFQFGMDLPGLRCQLISPSTSQDPSTQAFLFKTFESPKGCSKSNSRPVRDSRQGSHFDSKRRRSETTQYSRR